MRGAWLFRIAWVASSRASALPHLTLHFSLEVAQSECWLRDSQIRPSVKVTVPDGYLLPIVLHSKLPRFMYYMREAGPCHQAVRPRENYVQRLRKCQTGPSCCMLRRASRGLQFASKDHRRLLPSLRLLAPSAHRMTRTGRSGSFLLGGAFVCWVRNDRRHLVSCWVVRRLRDDTQTSNVARSNSERIEVRALQPKGGVW